MCDKVLVVLQMCERVIITREIELAMLQICETVLIMCDTVLGLQICEIVLVVCNIVLAKCPESRVSPSSPRRHTCVREYP